MIPRQANARPFPRDEKKQALEPLDLFSSETAGSPPVTLQENEYLQVVINKVTMKLHIVPIQTKSAATDKVRDVIMSGQRLTGKFTARYHSGNAKELQAARLVQQLRAQGTKVTKTTSHSSQQNPDAEIAIRSITDATRRRFMTLTCPPTIGITLQ